MSLVPESLEEVEGGSLSCETDRIGSIGAEDDLFSLRQGCEGDVRHAEFLECTASGTELTLAAVHDEQIWDGSFLIYPASKISERSGAYDARDYVPAAAYYSLPIPALRWLAPLPRSPSSGRVAYY